MLSYFIIQEIITNSHLEYNFDPYQLAGQATLTYLQNHLQMRTYLQLTQDEAKIMLETNKFSGAQVAPLPDMSSTATKQDNTIIELTSKQLDQ